jgi:MOSC domain-containing protein YiiM
MVRRIGSGWNCRVLTNGQVNQETRVDAKADIGAACREMLRWEDKVGNLSAFASAARARGVR